MQKLINYRRILSAIITVAVISGSFVLPVYAAGINYKDWSNTNWTDEADGIDAIPSQYSFTLDSDTKDIWEKTPVYQVIDSEEVNGRKNYLIIRLESPAGRGRIANSSSTYDPTVEGSLAYWINNIWTGIEPEDDSYVANPIGSTAVIQLKGTLLNESFKNYLVEKTWKLEACSAASLSQSTITAKAVIPSASEINHYVAVVKKINGEALSKSYGSSASLTRTVRDIKDGVYRNVYVEGEDTGTSGKLKMQPVKVNTTDTKRAWGMFWVSEDFFKNVKVNVDTLGEDVLDVIFEVNGISEENENSETILREIGYTTGDLIKMGVVEPPTEPVASGISISVENAVPGYPVTVDYTYSHQDGKEQGNTKIYWYVSDTENGEYEKITGAEGNSWSIWNVCENRYGYL